MTTRRRFNLGLLAGAAVSISGCAGVRSRSAVVAVDAHAHVFLRSLPMPDQRRAPSGYDAPPEDYLRMLDANGVSHGVIVQPSFLGTDNGYLVSSLRKYPERLRGIAVVEPSIAVDQLQVLQDSGVVGIRLNQIGLPVPPFASAPWPALLGEVRRRGWQVEVHQVARDLRPIVEPLLAAGVNVVVDHFGRPDENLGVDDPGFRHLLTLGATRKVWVKLSGAYRNGAGSKGEATVDAALPLLRSAFGLDRLVWGSDWPHTLFESKVDYASQRKLLDRWLPDPVDRDIVLRDTPRKLFGFDS